MKPYLKIRYVLVVCCLAALAGPAMAQRAGMDVAAAKSVAGTYNIANDVSLQGTVIKSTENSATPPIGAHLLLQTASGNVDVHLGAARLLHLAKMNVTQAASVRFIGQMHTVGQSSAFFARRVPVGTHVLAVRSTHGL